MDDLFSVADAVSAADDALRQPGRQPARPVPTGFALLDGYLSGGLRAGELCLIGGPPGLGKTALALQIVREVVRAGGAAVHLSFEQDVGVLLQRLVTIEAGLWHGLEGPTLRQVREAIETGAPGATVAERLARVPGGAQALRELQDYGERLLLRRMVGSAGAGLEDIREVVVEARLRTGDSPLVVVDHLQKVAGDDERAAHTAAGLREMAVAYQVPVLAVAATSLTVDSSARRRRAAHLRGPAALGSEPDVVLMLNEKVDAVARRHLMYDPRVAEQFADWLVLAIEKNRSGPAGLGLQLRKRLEQSRFEPVAEVLREELADEPGSGA